MCECAELSRLTLHLDRLIAGLRAQITIEAKKLAAEMAAPVIVAAERGAEMRIAEADYRAHRAEAERDAAERGAWALERQNKQLRDAAREKVTT